MSCGGLFLQAPSPFESLPSGYFAAIYADPPWHFETWGEGGNRNVTSKYPTMSVEEMCALPIASLAAPDCALFMWIVWPKLFEAIEVMKAWGFTYKTCAFCWLKADPYRLWADEYTPFAGLGYWTRANSEVCLLGTRGKPQRLNADVRQGIISPRREHSRKPDDIYGRIERLVGGPYLELFARQGREGWAAWGNEVNKFTPHQQNG
jgi:N6-adenosine-specific RNA methylase IME4